MKGQKLLVVGLINDVSDDPADAMEPYTPNGAGERLYAMVNAVKKISKETYCEKIEFININGLGGTGIDAAKILMKNRITVVCGVDAWRALGLRRASFWVDERDKAYLVPHPSGKNFVYNADEARLRTGHLIARLARL